MLGKRNGGQVRINEHTLLLSFEREGREMTLGEMHDRRESAWEELQSK